MCGRYKMSTKSAVIMQVFGVDELIAQPRDRYNIAPTDPVPVIRLDDAGAKKRELVEQKWGLIPFWAQDTKVGARMINARVETLLSKRVFKDAFEGIGAGGARRSRRCLVVSDGFYEWLKDGKNKLPHLIRFQDQRVFAFAGLWARWKGPRDADGKPTGQPLESCSIITGPANDLVKPVHDRMPVIFDPTTDADLIARWLDTSVTFDLSRLQKPRALPGLTLFPVDKRVGNVRNDDPSLAEPLPPPPQEPA